MFKYTLILTWISDLSIFSPKEQRSPQQSSLTSSTKLLDTSCLDCGQAFKDDAIDQGLRSVCSLVY